MPAVQAHLGPGPDHQGRTFGSPFAGYRDSAEGWVPQLRGYSWDEEVSPVPGRSRGTRRQRFKTPTYVRPTEERTVSTVCGFELIVVHAGMCWKL